MYIYYTKIPFKLSRHRLLYLFGSLALILLFLQWNDFLNRQIKTSIDLQATINYLKNNIQYKKHQKPLTSSYFLSYIAHQLQSPELKNFAYKIQQTGPKEFEISLDKVPYVTLMSWLGSLDHDLSVIFKQIDLSKTSTIGMVQARIVMLFDS